MQNIQRRLSVIAFHCEVWSGALLVVEGNHTTWFRLRDMLWCVRPEKKKITTQKSVLRRLKFLKFCTLHWCFPWPGDAISFVIPNPNPFREGFRGRFNKSVHVETSRTLPSPHPPLALFNRLSGRHPLHAKLGSRDATWPKFATLRCLRDLPCVETEIRNNFSSRLRNAVW